MVRCAGEYICKRSSRGESAEHCGDTSVLGAFADSFEFGGLRIEQALRLYLETFRLPGEAPLIFLVMEKFAERWHVSTHAPPRPDTTRRGPRVVHKSVSSKEMCTLLLFTNVFRDL